SLAFDTIFAEGQRRYVESLSSFVRQFLSEIEKPDFDYIEGLAPAIAIDQKTAARNPRSTVATTTEIYDFLRLLFSRVGEPFCPKCEIPVVSQDSTTMAEKILQAFSLEDHLKVKIFAISVWQRKGEHKYQLRQAKKQGVLRVRLDKVEMDIAEALELNLDKQKNHTVELQVGLVDFPIANDQSRQLAAIELLKIVEKGLRIGSGQLTALAPDGEKELFYSRKHACTRCGWQFPEIEPRLFSFNNPEGACQLCLGLGVQMVADRDLVIPNPRLTIAEGAIRPWSRTTSHTNWHQKVLQDLAKKYNFSQDTAVGALPDNVLDLILNGEPEDEPERFEGVLPNLERRYRETDSDYLKQEIEKYLVEQICGQCQGKRLRQEVLSIKLAGINIFDATRLTIKESCQFFTDLPAKVPARALPIASPIAKEVSGRLQYLLEVGLGYLTLDRPTSTLAGGEAQRVRLANQLGSGLTGIIYILDEPSIGLHARDHQKLLATIKELRDRANTVIVVEHDRETMLAADHIIDMGPGAGERGGEIIAEGNFQEIKASPQSLTGDYLAHRKQIELPKSEGTAVENQTLTISGAKGNNLRNLTVSFPLNKLICVTGVSGSGKSTLIEDTLARAVAKHFHGAEQEAQPYGKIDGLEHLDNIINVNQTPIGRTPRSNPATYTGALGPIRELFAQVEDARNRGYDPSRFSFNLRGGRCEHCHGDGQIKIEMNFLPDVYVSCGECRGKRFNPETLEVKYRNYDISDILAMTVDEAIGFFGDQEEVLAKLAVLKSVGLGYMRLGQSATTLSGGEAQRIKLAAELAKRETGKTLYILDEPTTGLHFEDIQQLLGVLSQLVKRGNTVIIIEHNLEVIACADWVIDLGPEGGSQGGELVAVGTPSEIMKNPASFTGEYLREFQKKAYEKIAPAAQKSPALASH
ncbi:MAG: excinuclease ABC subunit UvrA, partial [Patescibacteria group bacterium]